MPTINKLKSPYAVPVEEKPQRWSNSDNKRYKTAGWIKFRKGYIDRRLEKGECRCDKCNRPFTESKEIQLDHKTPISDGGDMFSYSNIQMLCIRCHTSKTSKEIRQKQNTGY